MKWGIRDSDKSKVVLIYRLRTNTRRAGGRTSTAPCRLCSTNHAATLALHGYAPTARRTAPSTCQPTTVPTILKTRPEIVTRSHTSSWRTILTQHKPDDTGTLTDAATISEQIREHELLRHKFRDAISSVGEEHYEQWAGMGPEQVLVFGESLDDVIDQLKPNGKDRRPTVVEYLTAEPPVLIL